MRRKRWLVVVPVIIIAFNLLVGCGTSKNASTAADGISIILPEPVLDSNTAVEKALLARRSIRDYRQEALTLKQLGQLLWAAQGITGSDGQRTAPSAGGLYPLEVYTVIGDVEGVAPGVYKYRPDTHSIIKVSDGDRRKALSQAALNQESISRGAIAIVIAAVYERTTGKYGERGIRYVHLEAGHAAQNIYLQAVALGLGTVTIGAFDDDGVKLVLGLPGDEEPLYIMPVGKTGN